MIFEASDFAHLNEPTPGTAQPPTEVIVATADENESPNTPETYLDRDIADYVRAGQHILGQTLSTDPSAMRMPTCVDTHKDPFAYNFTVYKMLEEQYGVGIRLTADGTKDDSGWMTVRMAPEDRYLTGRVFVDEQRHDRFVGRLSALHIHHTALDASDSLHDTLTDSIPVNPRPNLTAAEFQWQRQALLISGFMTSTLLRHLDFGEADGVRKEENAYYADQGLETNQMDDVVYENLSEAGYRPFEPEALWGIYQAEFQTVLDADPELAADLHARRQATKRQTSSTTNKAVIDYGLEF